MTRFQAWIDIALFIALMLIASQALALARALLTFPLPYLIILQGTLILLILYALLRYRGQRWSDVGMRPFRARDLGYALLTLLGAYGANFALMSAAYWLDPQAFKAHLSELTQLARLLSQGRTYAELFAMMLFVGVYEELAARGFLLHRSLTALGDKAAAVIFSAVLFGLGHLYQGWLGVVQTAVIGAVFAVAVLRFGSLWPAILAHSGLNTLYLVLSPLVEERLRSALYTLM